MRNTYGRFRSVRGLGVVPGLSWMAVSLTFLRLAVSNAAEPASSAQDPASGIPELRVDFGKPAGRLRPLHSVNVGPVSYGGIKDATQRFREAGFPLVRLHDCQWPEPAVVDIHTIFRDFRQDPAVAENYSFARTDDYLASVLSTGARIYYRLGESIEHSRRKYAVHPPADFGRWADICAGIVRHYNAGWADGFHHAIEYWEVWNEPEVRPQMWSGTDTDYFRLYETTVKRLKSQFPGIKVGGPATGSAGEFKDGVFEPAPLVKGFLEFCQKRGLPLDFFSWHRYSDDPADVLARARGVRQMLDRFGFNATESHLNEWNYLPRNDWGVFAEDKQEQREDWYAEMGGAASAAFTASVLLGLQDIPIDHAFYYSADSQGFGMFTAHGGPRKPFYAMKAFNLLLQTPNRVGVSGMLAGLAAAAGLNDTGSEATVLVSNLREPCRTATLQLLPPPGPAETGAVRVEVIQIESAHWRTNAVFECPRGPITFRTPVTAPSVTLVRLTRVR